MMKLKTRKLSGTLFTILSLSLSVFLDVKSSFAEQDDEYNFSWLDPEKKVYVLQNRRYRKTGAPELFLMGGISLSDTYRNSYQVQPRLAQWFSEEFGLEVFYSAKSNKENNAYKALEQAINSGGVVSSPYIREINNQFGVLFNWAPFYSKMNVFNSVWYFDWYFSLGAGTMQTSVGPKSKSDPVSAASWKDESIFAAYLGTGQLFHLSEHWKVRLDFLGHFYSAAIYGGIPNASADKAIFSNFAFNLGVGYKF